MITVELITALVSEGDEQLHLIPQHPAAHLWPREGGTWGLWHALQGVGKRAFDRWRTRDQRPLSPRLLERSRLFRLFTTHQDWTQAFLAAPTVLGVIDTYGIALPHPRREGRSPQPTGRPGVSNQRWIVGGKRCLLRNQWGLIVAWAWATAQVAATRTRVALQLIVVSAPSFTQALARLRGTPALRGWRPPRRWHLRRPQGPHRPALLREASGHRRCGPTPGGSQTGLRWTPGRDRPPQAPSGRVRGWRARARHRRARGARRSRQVACRRSRSAGWMPPPPGA